MNTVDKHLVGYCGLYCGACDILRLHREGEAVGRTPEWRELPARLRKHLPFKPQPIVCHGCSSDTVFGVCAHCFIRNCARKKGTVAVCTACERYPCFRHWVFGIVAWLFSIKKKLPHQKTKDPNLARIGCVGSQKWLVEQEEAWRCPECRMPFSWYRATCATCGRDLDGLKNFSLSPEK